MKFVNMTGRELTIYRSPADAEGVTFPAQGPGVKYAGFSPGALVSIDGIPVGCDLPAPARAPAPEDFSPALPEPHPGVLLILPYPVERAAVAMGRTDCLRMGPARFAGGTQTGAEGFASSLPGGPVTD